MFLPMRSAAGSFTRGGGHRSSESTTSGFDRAWSYTHPPKTKASDVINVKTPRLENRETWGTRAFHHIFPVTAITDLHRNRCDHCSKVQAFAKCGVSRGERTIGSESQSRSFSIETNASQGTKNTPGESYPNYRILNTLPPSRFISST